ncbi:ABC transporter substrate-binding protein [Massilia sp. TS11]|uniref:substrate-binding periplasmic protein n=1 Tax=Massilia sp. TS11 TaxID=2908003 RepID=UPI001EDB4C46|nr:ABC transporter substrate-binding protein [Massilia sp. TS11]MCG2584992.1 ABC transporter substrate-binding protein [Massilia sp. TS11]
MRRLLLLCCLALPATAAERLRLLTEEIPPSVMKVGNEISGYSTEKVRLMMARAKVDYSIDMYPWTRGYAMTQSMPNTCLYATVRIPEREALFKWVGPLAVSDWILYGRASDRRKLKDLEAARPLRIGAYYGDVRGDYLRDRGFQVEYVPKDELNLQKLIHGRIDLWVSSKRFAEIVIARKGLREQVVPVLTFRRASAYLACNHDVPDTLIQRLNAAIASINEDGSGAAIEQKYASWRD